MSDKKLYAWFGLVIMMMIGAAAFHSRLPYLTRGLGIMAIVALCVVVIRSATHPRR